MNKYFLSTAIVLGGFSQNITFASAEQTKDYQKAIMERVMVIGNAEKAKNATGSAQFIGKETLENFNYSDVNRILKRIPGVNLQEEEGYGNRPNIGLRGGRSERSADITLMEDGVLISPAPYAAPSAYYFPRTARMESVEVRKGSSTVKFGPRTTSGAVNLISSSIPAKRETEALVGYGTDNTQRVDLHQGNIVGNFGYVIDLGHEKTDGFKELDITGGDTGYSIQDLMGKFRISTDESADTYQSLELKLGATFEDSNETYLGLADADFATNPYRRYAGSQKDNMDADHQQYQLRHYVDFNDFDLTTTIYRNEFARNWYKVQSVFVNANKTSTSGSLSNAAALSALKGNTNLDGSSDNNITLRANNREYVSQGIQSQFATDLELGQTKHAVEIGVRYHTDKEDRFQHEDRYAINNGIMTLANTGVAGSNANREATAKATSLHFIDEIKYGKFTVSPGVRYEHIKLEREDYNSGSIRENNINVIVPGIGAGYEINDEVSIFGGVHKGFAPPSPGSTNDNEEESVNYEAGIRYNKNSLSAELVGFFNDYSNLLGECTLSSSCASGTEGEQFNAGEVEVQGIEASVTYDIASALNIKEVKLPISFNYTLTNAEFKNSFTSNFDEWGSVTAGDELPYIPEHQFFVSGGVVHSNWEAHISGKYMHAMRTQAGSGSIIGIESTDSHFVVDLAVEYSFYKKTRAFITIDNLFNEEYVAARRPAGARPGKPLTLLAGVKYKF